MKHLSAIAFVALAACANPPADENPNSVPNVLLSINERRQTADYVYVTGGINDGAAVGQTATFVATPDDTLLCTFRAAQETGVEGFANVVTAHRLKVPGIYSSLTVALAPVDQAPPNGTLANFTIETRSFSGQTTTTTGFGDPRFEKLQSVFRSNPTPCWRFG